MKQYASKRLCAVTQTTPRPSPVAHPPRSHFYFIICYAAPSGNPLGNPWIAKMFHVPGPRMVIEDCDLVVGLSFETSNDSLFGHVYDLRLWSKALTVGNVARERKVQYETEQNSTAKQDTGNRYSLLLSEHSGHSAQHPLSRSAFYYVAGEPHDHVGQAPRRLVMSTKS